MIDMSVKNLDYLAAHHAQNLIKKVEKDGETPITKALGVLKENGVYACFLYLLAREKEPGKEIVNEMRDLINEIPSVADQKLAKKGTELLDELAEKILKKDLSRLLLIREILEQMLIYARYGAKAQSEKGS